MQILPNVRSFHCTVFQRSNRDAAARDSPSVALRWAASYGPMLLLAASSALAQDLGVAAAIGPGDAREQAATIVDLAVERAEKQYESGLKLSFESVIEGRIETLDGDGKVTRVETERYLRYPLEGHLYLEVIARDGLPLDADAVQDEEKRKAKFVREARRHAARGERYEPDARSIRFDRQLMDRYETFLVGTEEVRGNTCWVIRYEPRPGRLPEVRMMDKALNRSTGTLWITQDGYHLARIKFQLQRPVRYLLGVFATLRSVEGQLDYEAVRPEFWMPKRLNIYIDLRVLLSLKVIRRRVRNDWVLHRPGRLWCPPRAHLRHCPWF